MCVFMRECVYLNGNIYNLQECLVISRGSGGAPHNLAVSLKYPPENTTGFGKGISYKRTRVRNRQSL